MSAIAAYELKIPQGTSWNQVITWKVGSTEVNTTGYSARMQLREKHSSSQVVAELTSSNGKIALTSNGQITLSLTAEETAALKAGRYVYDLEMVSGGGQVKRLLEGSVLISPEVTR